MRRLGRRSLLAALAAGTLGGCGFRPIYAPTASGDQGPAQAELAAVAVELIPDRPGQLLREALQTRLEGSGGAIDRRYSLGVGYGIAGEGIGIQQDNSSTRIRLVARARWTLRANGAAGATLASGLARAVDDYNILDQQYFAADLSNEAAQRRLADAVADQISLQLAAWFSHRLAAG